MAREARCDGRARQDRPDPSRAPRRRRVHIARPPPKAGALPRSASGARWLEQPLMQSVFSPGELRPVLAAVKQGALQNDTNSRVETRVVSRVAAKVQSGKRRLPSLQRAVRGPRARLGYGALGGRGVVRLYRVPCIMVQAGGESHRRALTQNRAPPIRRATPRSSRGRSARRHSTRRAPVRSGRAHVFSGGFTRA